jgi:hypothetical protein
MGKIGKKGILGGFSGMVGPVVGTSWKGLDVMRSRPPRKRGKSTEGQLKQMARMTLMNKFVKPLTDLLNETYDNGLVQMSGYNKALSLNMRNAVDGEYPSFTINFARVVIGQGDLLNVDYLAATSPSEGVLKISWEDNSNQGSARATDQAFMAVYCADLEEWKTDFGGPFRNAGSYTLDVAAFSGNEVHAYIGFMSSGAKFISTSLYAGKVNIL